MERNILVTAISGDIANGILKILKEDTDNNLFGCDVYSIAVGMDMVKSFWQTKYAVEDGYISDMIKKCKEFSITHLIPSNEREILIQTQEVLDICLDKLKTSEYLEHNNIPVVHSYHDLGEIKFDGRKYFVKPRKSNGSKSIKVLENKKDILAVDLSQYVIQDYIDGSEEYTIGVYRNNDVTNTIAFRRVLKDGYSFIVELENSMRLKKLANDVANIFKLQGYLNLQIKKSGDAFYIFEINPRISGTVRFRHMLGFTDLLWWLDLLDGCKTHSYFCKYKKAIGIKELNEKYLLLE